MVTAIVGMLAAVAVPRFTNASQRYRADAAVGRVAADIALAQQEAISSSSSRTLTFNTTLRTYTMTGTGAASANGSTYTVDLNLAPYHVTSLAAAVNSDITLPLTFDGYGKPNGTGAITIKVGTDRRTITVDAATGQTVVGN